MKNVKINMTFDCFLGGKEIRGQANAQDFFEMNSNEFTIKKNVTDDDIKEIEDKFLYQKRNRSYGVGLKHITNNISDVKDYMLSCKLAYTNRVCISPNKNGVNMNILEHFVLNANSQPSPMLSIHSSFGFLSLGLYANNSALAPT